MGAQVAKGLQLRARCLQRQESRASCSMELPSSGRGPLEGRSPAVGSSELLQPQASSVLVLRILQDPGGEAELFPWGLWDTHVKTGRSRAVHPGWQHRCRVLSARQGAKRALEVSVTQQGC